jgi:hypothetical protein
MLVKELEMEIASRQFAALDPRNAKGYGRQEIPISKDEELRSFIRRIRNSEDFNSALSVQPAGSWMVLDAFAERIA